MIKAPQAHTRSEFIIREQRGDMVAKLLCAEWLDGKFVSNYVTKHIHMCFYGKLIGGRQQRKLNNRVHSGRCVSDAMDIRVNISFIN